MDDVGATLAIARAGLPTPAFAGTGRHKGVPYRRGEGIVGATLAVAGLPTPAFAGTGRHKGVPYDGLWRWWPLNMPYTPSSCSPARMILAPLQHGDGLIARHRREVLKEVVEPIVCFEVLHGYAHRNPRAANTGVPPRMSGFLTIGPSLMVSSVAVVRVPFGAPLVTG